LTLPPAAHPCSLASSRDGTGDSNSQVSWCYFEPDQATSRLLKNPASHGSLVPNNERRSSTPAGKRLPDAGSNCRTQVYHRISEQVKTPRVISSWWRAQASVSLRRASSGRPSSTIYTLIHLPVPPYLKIYQDADSSRPVPYLTGDAISYSRFDFRKYHQIATRTGTPVAVFVFIRNVDEAGIAEQRNGLASAEVLRNP